MPDTINSFAEARHLSFFSASCLGLKPNLYKNTGKHKAHTYTVKINTQYLLVTSVTSLICSEKRQPTELGHRPSLCTVLINAVPLKLFSFHSVLNSSGETYKQLLINYLFITLNKPLTMFRTLQQCPLRASFILFTGQKCIFGNMFVLMYSEQTRASAAYIVEKMLITKPVMSVLMKSEQTPVSLCSLPSD